MTHEELHSQLVALCDGIVTAYRNDLLIHDLHNIKQHDLSCQFLHFSRGTGTYMVYLIAADEYPAKGAWVPYLFGTADREHCLKGFESVVEHCCNPGNGTHICHWWDGRMFRQITLKRAMTIAEEYAERVRHAWRAGIVNCREPVTSFTALGM